MMMNIRQVWISSFLHTSLLDLTTRWTRRTRSRTRTRWTRRLEGPLSLLIETLVFALLIANEKMIPWLNQGFYLYRPEEVPRHGSGLFSSPLDQTAFESRDKMRFSRSVGEPSGTYPKRSDDSSRGRPAGPVIGPVSPIWAPLGLIFDGCVHVIVLFPKWINSRQTESGWGSYDRFTEPHSAWISSDYGLRIWKMIYPFWSSRQALRNVILWFFIWDTSRLLFCRRWIGIRLGHVLESLILLFSWLVPANKNITKTHGNMLVWTLIRWSNYNLVIFQV
jgi:hypothetical protein